MRWRIWGSHSLRLVNPVEYDPGRIEGIAHGTRDLVSRIRHFTTLEEALADCVRVHAYVGKPRAARWARTDPKASAAELLAHAEAGPVAVLFGPEDHGLENDSLDRAHATVTIPTTAHASLNLAQAVLIAGYELHLAAGDATRRLPKPRHDAPGAAHEQFERTFATFARALEACDFFKTRNPELVMRTVRSLVYRASPRFARTRPRTSRSRSRCCARSTVCRASSAEDTGSRRTTRPGTADTGFAALVSGASLPTLFCATIRDA